MDTYVKPDQRSVDPPADSSSNITRNTHGKRKQLRPTWMVEEILRIFELVPHSCVIAAAASILKVCLCAND